MGVSLPPPPADGQIGGSLDRKAGEGAGGGVDAGEGPNEHAVRAVGQDKKKSDLDSDVDGARENGYGGELLDMWYRHLLRPPDLLHQDTGKSNVMLVKLESFAKFLGYVESRTPRPSCRPPSNIPRHPTTYPPTMHYIPTYVVCLAGRRLLGGQPAWGA